MREESKVGALLSIQVILRKKKKEKVFLVTVKETEISWFAREDELIFVLVKVKLMMEH